MGEALAPTKISVGSSKRGEGGLPAAGRRSPGGTEPKRREIECGGSLETTGRPRPKRHRGPPEGPGAHLRAQSPAGAPEFVPSLSADAPEGSPKPGVRKTVRAALVQNERTDGIPGIRLPSQYQ